ncbi:MAG: hypothetical protein Q8K88_00845 [Bradyrhizobium sp.]|nr:hypothetical protein [Bradyrhizobium sp.]
MDFRSDFRSKETKMIHRVALAILAMSMAAGAAFAQTTPPADDKNKAMTNCTTTGAATSGHGEDKTNTSMAIGNSAILPDAGGTNSAAPTVQSGGKPMEVRKDCPPDGKAR